MFLLSKFISFLIDPATILLLLLLLASGLHILGRRRASARVFLTTSGLALVIAVLPAGTPMIAALENRFPPRALPERVDGVIVLGGAVSPALTAARGRISLDDSAERIVAFVRLARRYPDARLIYTAGSGDPFDQSLREADAVRPLLDLMGIDPGRILFERDSRNTFENARNSRALARPIADERWILITSARHMPRAMGTFRAQGWTVIAYPVDYTTEPGDGFRLRFNLGHGLGSLHAGLHEWVGLFGYYVLGRSDSLFPAPAVGGEGE